MSKLFFTSDLHFSHPNITRFCPQFRPATSDAGELNEYLIARWNETVAPNDTVYNLGDVSFAHNLPQLSAVLSRLNGRHHVILGNHDDLIVRHQTHLLTTPKHDGHPLLSSIQPYLKLKLPEIRNTLILFHYPIDEWDGCHKGWYHLYGHLHQRLAPLRGRALNAGWDLHGRFLTLQDIDDFLRDLPVVSRFHHPAPASSADSSAAHAVKTALQALNRPE